MNSVPKYRELANSLKADITSGRLKPGDHLMTEMEMCEVHGVSRHTAREALRILSDDGLIARRRGAGTVVADVASPAFAQPIGDFDSILQYAHDIAFRLVSDRAAVEAELAPLGLSGEYHRFDGVRQQDGKAPLAYTVIYALSALSPDADTVTTLTTSLSEWIEQKHDIPVQKVTQRMEAVALRSGPAKALGVDRGSPALRTSRRYRDTAGRIILLSESLHPAGRFAYEMRLDRTR